MQETEPVVDTTAEELPPDQPPDVAPTHDSAPSAALARRAVTHEVIRPLDPAEVVASMRTHQELLRQILDPSDWQGQPDAKGSFVKKSGWRKIALAYNLALGRVSEYVERDPEGTPQRATYTAWAEAPNGRRVEASGHCAFSESRFSGPRGNVTKLENDMRATAETRAKNRAISDLIGMGKVSAEEVDAGAGGGEGHVQPHGPPISDEAGAQLRRALAYVLECDPLDPRIAAVLGMVEKKVGYVSESAFVGIGVLCGAVKTSRETSTRVADAAGDEHGAAPVDVQPDDRPPAGTVDPPDLGGAASQAAAEKLLRTAGCTCPKPISSGSKPAETDDSCPLKGHGIPF